MINKNKHKITLIHILKDIYADPTLRHALGFKGGTALFLFYDLPRFSIDLDFNLTDINQKDVIFEKIKKILLSYGNLSESIIKRNTIFFLLSYGHEEKKIKIEISTREHTRSFEVKNYLGIPIRVMKQEDMFAEKLSALLTRTKFASRDLFDIWFILRQQWNINEEVVTSMTGYSMKNAIAQAIEKVKKINKNQLLQGLGELLDEKQKIFVKEKLKEELIFHLSLLKQEEYPH